MKIVFILIVVLATAYGRSSRIVQGDESEIDAHPHQISLRSKSWFWWSGHRCGGSIIGPNVVLTAAHCVDDTSLEYGVLVGGHARDDGDLYEVSRVILADGYNKTVVNGPLGTFQQDMAILLFNGAYFPEKNIIELASSSDGLFTNEMVTISGWGKTESGGLSERLQEKTVQIISEDDCQKAVEELNGEIYNGHICFLHNTGGSCSGDSGGPMVHASANGDKRLIGVTSWGVSTCDTNYDFPSVYARVTYFRNWIQKETGI